MSEAGAKICVCFKRFWGGGGINDVDLSLIISKARNKSKQILINYYLKTDDLEFEPALLQILEYYYYHSKCKAHIEYAQSKLDSVRVERVV